MVIWETGVVCLDGPISYEPKLKTTSQLSPEADLRKDLPVFEVLNRWGDFPLQTPEVADELVTRAIHYSCQSQTNMHQIVEALVKALADGGVWQEINCEQISLGGMKFLDRRELKAWCQSTLKSYQNGELLKEEDSKKIKELLSHHPRSDKKAEGCVAIRAGQHPTFALRCFFVVRGDGSEEDFSYIRCVDNTPSFTVTGQRRICYALGKILQVNPEAMKSLAELAARRFPPLRGKFATVPKHRNWVGGLLLICGYMPSLSIYLHILIVRQLVQIDSDINQLNAKTPEVGVGEGLQGAWKDFMREERDAMANILDAQMMLFFEYLQTNLMNTAKDDTERRCQQQQLVSAMMTIFKDVILNTHKVKCVQFLWFYLCSMCPVWAEAFLQLLLENASNKLQELEKRCVAFSYLASFLGRAKFLNVKYSVRSCEHLALFGNTWLQELEVGHGIREQIGVSTREDVLKLMASLVQAFCYIIVWHVEGFREETDENGVNGLDKVLPDLGQPMDKTAMTQVLTSRYMPFSLMRRPVAKEFCRAIRQTRPKLAEVLQQQLYNVPPVAEEDEMLLKGTGYFPFDPFLLAHSNIFLMGIYQSWQRGDDGFDEESDREAENYLKARNRAESSRPSDSASDMEDDQDDFTDEADVASRGFTPQVGPSPAFRPDADMEMLSPSLGPILPPAVEGLEDDDFLPPQAIDTDNFMNRRLAHQSYKMGLDEEL